MFKLEALRALHGDALLLHYGTRAKPKYALIDGGPAGVWTASVRPRLQELRKNDKAVPLRWMLLSHIDEDHVLGLIDMVQELVDAMPQPKDATASSRALFHNTPGPPAPQAGVASGPAVPPQPADPVRAGIEAALVSVAAHAPPMNTVSSYRQGAELANLALHQAITRNPTTGDRLLAGDELPADIVSPLRVTVISPTVTVLNKLIKKWQDQLGKDGGVITSNVETKIQNLSSIVVLVEKGSKRMLLTGDALDFDVIAGLKELDLLDDNGELHVDLLKLPHHGAEGNCHEELFQTVKAKHYVISADGRHGNPDEPTLERLVESEKDRDCKIWITNGPGEGGLMAATLDARYETLTELIALHNADGIEVRHPSPGDLSVTISL